MDQVTTACFNITQKGDAELRATCDTTSILLNQKDAEEVAKKTSSEEKLKNELEKQKILK